MTIEPVAVAIAVGVANLLVAPFVGYMFRSTKALEAKQIADNAAREKEITALAHKIEMAALIAKQNQESAHRDAMEMKSKLDNLSSLLGPLIERLGLHIPAVGK